MPDAFDPVIGEAVLLRPGLRRIVAPNPSPMTFRGTNTYLLGVRDIAVIDPGPAAPEHLEAILGAIGPGQRITHIIVSHTHFDHTALVPKLQAVCGARTYGFGDAQAGRSPIMQTLAAAGMVGGGEGVDGTFSPDVTLGDGAIIEAEGWRLNVLHTPGHIGNHICLAWGHDCFTADHVMGWSTSLVSPPDGDLSDFMASCERLASGKWHYFYPGHGDVITAPAARLNWLMAHRNGREAAILDSLRKQPARAADLAQAIYTEVPTPLLQAATRNVLAHLIDLVQKNKVEPVGGLHSQAQFRLL